MVVSGEDDSLRQNCKAYDSLARSDWLDAKNPPVQFHGLSSHCVLQRHKGNYKLDIRAKRGRNSRNHKRASLTNVSTVSRALVFMAVCVLPSEIDRRLDGVARRFPCPSLGRLHNSPCRKKPGR